MQAFEKVIFLDRDGVINKNVKYEYVTSWAKFNFLPNVFEALKLLKDNEFKVIIISNQQGVGKGLYTEAALADMTERMLARIQSRGGKIHSVHYCPHLKEADCVCRKPKVGLFKQALVGKSVDIKNTFFIGDTERDVETGKKLGCRTILVLSGNTESQAAVSDFKFQPDFIAKDLLAAVKNVVLKGKVKSWE
ncbi:MAG: HAD family hydrolase [Candidatus Omnitrophota bacterium]